MLISGCTTKTDPSSNEDLGSLSFSWAEKINYYSEYYQALQDALMTNKNSDYFSGFSKATSVNLSGTDLYDSVEIYVLNKLEQELNREERIKIDELLLLLDNTTWELNELLASEHETEIEKKELLDQVTKIFTHLNNNGTSTKDLNFYNLLRNPKVIADQYSEANIHNMIEDINADLTQLNNLINKNKNG